ncbi:unnamed protein product [Sphagnum balticum]
MNSANFLQGLRTAARSIKVSDITLLSDGVYELQKGLITLFVDYDGWYDDHQGTQQRLSKEVLRVVQTMKVGQKVLIVEEKEDRNPEDEKEDWGNETRIWLVHFSAIRLLLTRK